ncbi:MAG: RsiV family protein [Spirochaetaceae bacterium]|jgi:hypothetical protein|nr:RsiV family protein [Spirochaetaceae bacterium]
MKLFKKNFLVKIPVLIFLAGLFLGACAGLSSKKQGPFEQFTLKRSIPSAGKAGNTAAFDFRLVEVSQPGPLQTLVHKLLYNGRSAADYQNLLTEDWKNEFTQFTAEDPGYGQNWNYEEVHTLSLAGDYAVIIQRIFYYQGGAHPNTSETAYIVDMREVRQIRLGDIISKGGIPALTAMVDRELRLFSEKLTKEALPPGVPLSNGIYFEDTLTLPEYFYPRAEGLSFGWNPYEIAPYAAGRIEIFLTWGELQGLLSPGGEKFAAAFRGRP